jgi:hypothetical protein
MAETKKAGEDFCEVLALLRHGATVASLTGELRDLVSAVRDTGRRGKLVLTIDVKPASTGDTTVLTLADTIKVTKPTAEKVETLFYADTKNVLQRNDPRQPELAGLRRPADAQREEAATK